MVKDVLESGHLHLAMAGNCGDAWGSAAFRCLVGLAGQNVVLFHVANISIFGFWLNHQFTSGLKWWLEILSSFSPSRGTY